jgi:molybdenum ABC transporter molybdate-binding protein
VIGRGGAGLLFLMGAVFAPPDAPAGEPATLRIYAAGSLKPALTELAAAFSAAHGIAVEATFGASGLLRARLEADGAADLFASADLDNPRALERDGKAGPVALFARNRLCVLVRPDLALTPETVLDAMLDPLVKLGTSTPRADPSGDYAWAVFAKAGAVRPGSRERLEAKALKLVGAADSAAPPPGLGAYAWHLRDGRADLFLTYCTNARLAAAELPGARAVDLPRELATGAEYGLTVLKNADAAKAATLALFVLSPQGQGILAKHGFSAPLLPLGGPAPMR